MSEVSLENINLSPLADRILVKLIAEESSDKNGIIIPSSATEKPQRGEVISVGKGKVLDNGKIRPTEIKVGDKILFGKYAGTEIELNKVPHILIQEEDILATIE